MTIRAPFQPSESTQLITTGAVSASVNVNPVSKSIRLVNTGATNPCHVVFGIGPQTATTAGLIIRANSEIIIQKGDGVDTVAAIQNTGATTLYVQAGEGGQ